MVEVVAVDITVVVAVHLGTAVQPGGVVQVVLAAADKEQTEIVAQPLVQMELQTLVAVEVAVTMV